MYITREKCHSLSLFLLFIFVRYNLPSGVQPKDVSADLSADGILVVSASKQSQQQGQQKSGKESQQGEQQQPQHGVEELLRQHDKHWQQKQKPSAKPQPSLPKMKEKVTTQQEQLEEGLQKLQPKERGLEKGLQELHERQQQREKEQQRLPQEQIPEMTLQKETVWKPQGIQELKQGQQKGYEEVGMLEQEGLEKLEVEHQEVLDQVHERHRQGLE